MAVISCSKKNSYTHGQSFTYTDTNIITSARQYFPEINKESYCSIIQKI